MDIRITQVGFSGAATAPNGLATGAKLKQHKQFGTSSNPASKRAEQSRDREPQAPESPEVPGACEGRHLTAVNLDILWRGGSPLVVPIEGDPQCWLRLDQRLSQMVLLTEYEPPAPDLAALKNIDFQIVDEDGLEHAAIVVHVDGEVYGAYGLLTSIADDLQVHKASLAPAVMQAVARHRDMIARRAGLTTEAEIGLFGELLFLEYLIQTVGVGPAVDAWQGPLGEEHDFVFDDVECEIKSTASERRRHFINGLTQLVPNPGVSLAVISIQLTRTTSARGRTLPHLMTVVRDLAGGHAPAFDTRMDALGWKGSDVALCRTHWSLRSTPRAYHVERDFPAITAPLLAQVVPNFPTVSDITYRVDLTDLPHASLPAPADGFIEQKDH